MSVIRGAARLARRPGAAEAGSPVSPSPRSSACSCTASCCRRCRSRPRRLVVVAAAFGAALALVLGPRGTRGAGGHRSGVQRLVPRWATRLAKVGRASGWCSRWALGPAPKRYFGRRLELYRCEAVRARRRGSSHWRQRFSSFAVWVATLRWRRDRWYTSRRSRPACWCWASAVRVGPACRLRARAHASLGSAGTSPSRLIVDALDAGRADRLRALRGTCSATRISRTACTWSR